jgi:enoyl-CoA hydratase
MQAKFCANVHIVASPVGATIHRQEIEGIGMTRTVEDMVTYEARDGRAYIVLRRAEKRNALTYEMFDRIMDLVAEAEIDDDVKVVIFKAEGEDFCTGHDLAQIGSEYGFDPSGKGRRPSQRARLRFDKRHVEQFRSLFYCMKPTLALIQGYCVGAGLHLVEATDLAIAADDAKIGHPEQKAGLAGAAYMTSWLNLALGPRKARELLLLGDMMSGTEAAQCGLINKAVPAADLDAAGERWAEKIVRLPRDAIAIGKAATHLALDSMGMTSQFVHGYVSHALGTNIRYEEGEFNFMRNRREKGVRGAAHAREEFFATKDPSAPDEIT